MEPLPTLAQCLQPAYLFASFGSIDNCLSLRFENSSFSNNETIERALINLMDTCMQSYCEQSDSRYCTNLSSTLYPTDGFFSFSDSLCGNVKPSVNSDIGGIGVSTFSFSFNFLLP